MTDLIYIIKVLYHFVVFAFLYCLFLKGDREFSCKQYSIKFTKNKSIIVNHNIKIGLFWCVIFCVLEAVYTVICSDKGVFIADRFFYAKRYSLGIYTKNSSLGLYYLQKILSVFSNNPYLLFIVVAVLFILLTVKACNEYDDYTCYVLLFIGSSQYLLYGTYQLKQALCNAIIAIALACVFKGKNKTAYLLVVLAIVFHEIALIAIPIIIILTVKNKKYVRVIAYIVLIVAVLQFQNLSRIIINIISYLWPDFSSQVDLYLDDTGALENSGTLMQIIKGIPFFIIPIAGYLNRKQLIKRLDHYHDYMFISIFAAASMILQGYMTWMWRFTELFLLPVFVFMGQIAMVMSRKNRIIFVSAEVLMMLVITIRKLIICYFNYGGII